MPKLRLRNYLLQALPSPPLSVDYNTPASAAFMADILGNDVSGDCTCAAVYHIIGAILAASGSPIPYTATDCVNFYKMLSGWNGIEDDPSDTGLNVETVLAYWKTYGLLPDNDKCYGYMAIDATNKIEVMTSIWLFENVDFGVDLADAWLNPSGSGFVWDVAGKPDPENGHSFMSAKYDTVSGVNIDTWGLNGYMTWPAVAKYASNTGELYTILTPDSINRATAKAPNGLNWTQLVSDFESLS